uniref:Uncharacterized protein n=1 Tax=Cyprinus carpio TaxID=7962 RepID=A0A8C1VA40_CYPCA
MESAESGERHEERRGGCLLSAGQKISEEQSIKKKGYDHERAKTRVNIGAAFQRWRELKEREGLESDAEVAFFLLDRRVTLIYCNLLFSCFLIFVY